MTVMINEDFINKQTSGRPHAFTSTLISNLFFFFFLVRANFIQKQKNCEHLF